MPTCRVRYRFNVDQSNLTGRNPGVLDALAEEERMPDEWGEPGVLLKRRWVSAVAGDGRDYASALNHGQHRPRGRLEPIGGVMWAESDFSDA